MMGLVENVVVSVLNGVLIGMDIVCFFLFVRLLSCRFNAAILTAFDRTGKPLVDWVMRFSEQTVAQFTSRPLTVPQLIAIQLFTLWLLRWLIIALLSR